MSAIGTFTPDAREVETGVVVRSRVVVESREAALEEAGITVAPHPSALGETMAAVLGHRAAA